MPTKKPKQPPKNRTHDLPLMVYVNGAQKERIIAAAEKSGQSMSSFVRAYSSMASSVSGAGTWA